MSRPRRPVMRWLVPTAALALSGVLVLAYVLRDDLPWNKPPASGGRPILQSDLVGQAAPSLDTSDTTNGAASSLIGSGPVVVNFWASWCPPCRAEHPTLLKLEAAGVPIIGVDIQDTPEDARSYLNELGDPFAAVVLDSGGQVAARWGVTAPPQTFILDAEGQISAHFAGAMVGSDFEQRFVPALQGAGWTGSLIP